MKKILFDSEKDGFYGTYYENPCGSDCTVIGLFGDDPNDYMAKCGVKWLHKNGVNALCMSPGKKNNSQISTPPRCVDIYSIALRSKFFSEMCKAILTISSFIAFLLE